MRGGKNYEKRLVKGKGDWVGEIMGSKSAKNHFRNSDYDESEVEISRAGADWCLGVTQNSVARKGARTNGAEGRKKTAYMVGVIVQKRKRYGVKGGNIGHFYETGDVHQNGREKRGKEGYGGPDVWPLAA